MPYAALVYDGSSFRQIDISAEVYGVAKEAKEVIAGAVDIEEKFNLLLENYLELEIELLSTTVRKALSFGVSWDEGADMRQFLNRRLSNLLSSCRLYVDQVPHRLNASLGRDSDVLAAYKSERSKQYDARSGYQLMEALRNYSQHAGFPIHSVSLAYGTAMAAGERTRVHWTEIQTSLERLREDKKFKKAALASFCEVETADLRTPVREYVSGLFRVHGALREAMRPYIERAEKSFASILEGMPPSDTRHYKSLRLSKMNEAGTPVEEVVLLEDMISRRQTLERRNGYPGELASLVITSSHARSRPADA